MTTERKTDLREGEQRPSLVDELLARRYLRKDDAGRVIEDRDGMLWRVANAIASVEKTYGASDGEVKRAARAFHRIMSQRLFLPNSPTLMNAGLPKGMLSACFVLDIDDSIESIFDTVKAASLVQKAGGGTGFAFDSLRPTGDRVASSGGETSGPISFMRVFAEATGAIQQGARRRGANMGMMSVEHPDILSFVAAKSKPGDFSNFNLSVKVTDAFMQALESDPDRPHVVVNPRDGRRYRLPKSLSPGQYGLNDLVPCSGEADDCFTVADIWNLIVNHAHATGEPGVCFIDRVNAENPTPALGPIRATNPCGEQPLLGGESCCLGSIDVSRFVMPDRDGLNWEGLADTVRWSVRFLDDVIDANRYPLEDIEAISKANRKIGLGVMGFADALALLGLRYDTQEATAFARKLMGFVQRAAHEASAALAESRGAFPNWSGSVWDTERHRPMRNASCTTIAPTGSISILSGCSAGIEPVFSLAYRRLALDGKEFIQVHPLLERIGGKDGWLTDQVRRELLEGVPLDKIEGIPSRLADSLVTAHEISPEWHVKMQASFQLHIDNAVSKTINLPKAATVEDVDWAFRLAHKMGCKGTTVYRDGSREGQVLSGGRAKSPGPIDLRGPRPRVRVTGGKTFKYRMGCGTLFVTVNRDEQGVCEVFANLGKAGGCPSQSEATCRAISVALRSGVSPNELIEQLKGIRCLSAARAKKNGDSVDVLSCPDAIARAIQETMDGQVTPPTPTDGKTCPDCGGPLRKEEGCLACSCGYTKCG